MKYIVVLGDGMADEPVEALDMKTPLEFAKTPTMDRLSQYAEIGMAKTIPDGMSPGSDTANLAVMGYDPKKYYTGRSPLEALSIGVNMKDTDVALRCNIVTLSDDDLPYAEKTILDHSSDEISTEDADVLVKAVKEAFENETYQFYTGTSYRHLLIWDKGEVAELTPPHDILERVIGAYLPEDAMLSMMMEKSYEILNHHPLNEERAKRGLNKANSLWFWGAGTKPCVTSFKEKTGLKGTMISAVDLLKGIAVGAQMEVVQVPGANGGLHTNYEGKANAALKALLEDGSDFVYVHLEGPDEMGHQGKCDAKVLSIEYLDDRIIRPICEGLDQAGEPYRMLILPDHPTPLRIRTHSADPVPYLLFDSRKHTECALKYNEKDAGKSGIFIENGYTLIDRLIQG
ncbi:MAG: cofactor-independent phosphoglycerate mutase [Lachnospiraceae bacterium]|nr:cofactor-independent phosphoglycerate mutase [Lachnospiraceae bacterium]